MGAHVQEVIITDLKTIGRGIHPSLVRSVKQFWSLDGTLLGEIDTHPPNHLQAIKDIIMNEQDTSKNTLTKIEAYIQSME